MGQLGQKCFEAEPNAFVLRGDLRNGLIDQRMLFLEAQSPGCGNDIADVGLPSLISIKVEELEENFDLLHTEDRILRDYVLSEGGHSVFLDPVSSRSAAHE